MMQSFTINKALKDITTQEWMDVFRMHAEDGVDFMTIHCGINKRTAQRFKDNKRITNICIQRRLYHFRMDGNYRK